MGRPPCPVSRLSRAVSAGSLSPQTVTIDGMSVHLTHWGAFEAVSDGERLTEVRPWRGDPEPVPLIGNVASAQHHPARITWPYVRKGWLGQRRTFHHAQSQVHRFLNCLGGDVRHVNSYSLGTSSVLLPYVIADVNVLLTRATAKSVVAEHSELVVAFGGLSPKNAAVSPGGVSRHNARSWVSAARARGCRFVSVSPIRDDTPAEAQAEWIAPRPG